MIGNDIIDRVETQQTTNWKRPGFLNKLFTEQEQAFVYDADDPFTRVWHLWSMKESAYKVCRQQGYSRFFKPTSLVCQLTTETTGTVTIDELTLTTSTAFHPNYIFSTATRRDACDLTKICLLPARDQANQSAFMREQVISAIAADLNLNPANIHLAKNASGVPELFHQGERLATSLSITHHGNYGAYSLLKP